MFILYYPTLGWEILTFHLLFSGSLFKYLSFIESNVPLKRPSKKASHVTNPFFLLVKISIEIKGGSFGFVSSNIWVISICACESNRIKRRGAGRRSVVMATANQGAEAWPVLLPRPKANEDPTAATAAVRRSYVLQLVVAANLKTCLHPSWRLLPEKNGMCKCAASTLRFSSKTSSSGPNLCSM